MDPIEVFNWLNKEENIKICIMVSSLGVGGAERSSAILSTMLVDAGYNVTIISVLDEIEYDYKGELVNLGVLTSNKSRILKKLLKFYYTKKVFAKKGFDYAIDATPRQFWLKQWLINFLIFKDVSVVFVIHNYKLNLSFPKQRFLAKNLYKNSYKLVTVSEASLQKIKSEYGFTNGICIHNAFDQLNLNQLSEINTSDDHNYDFILSYGRIVDESKNYSFLIRTYSRSKLPKLGVKLMILGEGPDKIKIQSLVATYKIESFVIFKEFTKNPFPYIKRALFTTLTSNYEGFPMVLIESLAMGVPVVSVDCKSGPSEIIVTGRNGILVPFQKEKAFTEALNKMIQDQGFYKECRKGTIPSVSKYKIENIIPKWQNILPSKR